MKKNQTEDITIKSKIKPKDESVDIRKSRVIEVCLYAIYKRTLFYPKNALAHKLAGLMTRKSFTREVLNTLNDMGFQIVVTKPELELPEFK